MRRIAVIGAGGHAKVVISALRASGDEVSVVFDDDPALQGYKVLGAAVCGPITMINSQEFDAAVIAIGGNETREKVTKLVKLPWATVISPAAWVDPSVKIGAGTVIFAGAILQPDSIVGEHTIVNTGATIDHDCVIGDFVHIAPGVNLAGNVVLEDGVFLGIGSTVIPGRRVGRWSTVGAGALVLRNIESQQVAYGIPARAKGG